ncbi:MAG: hypothetical protein FJ109_00670 [Deltaproteobacteria bacterium]|nr:hypothetical protein [Deltaproteobacteria bacterium]
MRRSRFPGWLIGVLVFLIAFGGLALASWDRVWQPSPHFHFVDLAESFMHGRLDTVTPKRSKGKPVLPDDPPGLQEAIDRQIASGGWNDWVSYYEAVLQTGELFKGVWPWAAKKEKESGFEWKNRFVTLSGDWAEFDRTRDIKRVCHPRPFPGEDPGAVAAWDARDRFDAENGACLAEAGSTGTARNCGVGMTRTTCLNRRHFVSFPPFPAVAMLPFVALVHYHFNDVLFTLALAALNSLLLYLLYQSLRKRGYVTRSTAELLVLVFLFTFGTVNFFSSIRGEVWFTALVVGITMHLLYLLFATDLRSPFLAGLFLALGFATRTPLAFASAYFGLQWLLQKQPWNRAGILLRVRQLALFAAPCIAVGVALMLYNMARFDNPFEFGHKFLADGTRPSIVDHGMFSFWFLPRNLAAAFANVPQFLPHYPYVKITGHGLSLLATTPVFFYLLWPRREHADTASRERFHWPLHRILWVTVACTALPGLLYQNTGWLQFGYRFALDYMPLLFLLLALDERKRGWLFYSLVGVCFLVNLFGAVTFSRFPQFYN